MLGTEVLFFEVLGSESVKDTVIFLSEPLSTIIICVC